MKLAIGLILLTFFNLSAFKAEAVEGDQGCEVLLAIRNISFPQDFKLERTWVHDSQPILLAEEWPSTPENRLIAKEVSRLAKEYEQRAKEQNIAVGYLERGLLLIKHRLNHQRKLFGNTVFQLVKWGVLPKITQKREGWRYSMSHREVSDLYELRSKIERQLSEVNDRIAPSAKPYIQLRTITVAIVKQFFKAHTIDAIDLQDRDIELGDIYITTHTAVSSGPRIETQVRYEDKIYHFYLSLIEDAVAFSSAFIVRESDKLAIDPQYYSIFKPGAVRPYKWKFDFGTYDYGPGINWQ